jgi:cytochrome P450
MTEGAEWKKRRRILSASFNFALINEQIPSIVEIVNGHLANIKTDGQTVSPLTP